MKYLLLLFILGSHSNIPFAIPIETRELCEMEKKNIGTIYDRASSSVIVKSYCMQVNQ